jgi:DNA-binding MarR family transcriptional regulator
MDKETQSYKLLLNVTAKVRALDVDMTLLGFSTLLAVMEHDGIGMADLTHRVKTSTSSLSRVIAVLSGHGYRTKAGLDLVSIKDDPTDRRYRNIYLTDKGKKLAKEMDTTAKRFAKKMVGD